MSYVQKCYFNVEIVTNIFFYFINDSRNFLHAQGQAIGCGPKMNVSSTIEDDFELVTQPERVPEVIAPLLADCEVLAVDCEGVSLSRDGK